MTDTNIQPAATEITPEAAAALPAVEAAAAPQVVDAPQVEGRPLDPTAPLTQQEAAPAEAAAAEHVDQTPKVETAQVNMVNSDVTPKTAFDLAFSATPEAKAAFQAGLDAAKAREQFAAPQETAFTDAAADKNIAAAAAAETAAQTEPQVAPLEVPSLSTGGTSALGGETIAENSTVSLDPGTVTQSGTPTGNIADILAKGPNAPGASIHPGALKPDEIAAAAATPQQMVR